MDPQTRQRLEERVRKEVEIILREGVQPYLKDYPPQHFGGRGKRGALPGALCPE